MTTAVSSPPTDAARLPDNSQPLASSDVMAQQQDAESSGTRYMLQEIAAHLGCPDIEDTERAASQFDVSPFRLWLLFKSVDRDNDGHVTKEELVECLTNTERLQASVLETSPLRQLWTLLLGEGASTDEVESEHIISFQQFCRLIRFLWLQQLLSNDLDDRGQLGKDYSFECIDFAGSYFEHRTIPGRLDAESRRFFTMPRHPRAKMRWIDVPCCASSRAVRVLILRLAVKYRFHPTSVEDAIELEQQTPKVNSFENSLLDLGDFRVESIVWIRHGGLPGTTSMSENAGRAAKQVSTAENDASPPHTQKPNNGNLIRNPSFGSAYGSDCSAGEEYLGKGHGLHYFITIPMFELTAESLSSLEKFDTIVKHSGSIPDEDNRLVQLEPLHIDIKQATLGMFVASDPEANLVVTVSTQWKATRVIPHGSAWEVHAGIRLKDDSMETNEGDLCDAKVALVRVKQLLEKRYAIQRHSNSNWLMHAIIDAVVDNLRPISRSYEAQLQRMSARLLELGHRLTPREVKEMLVMKRDLEWLQHELRPLHRVVRHLIDDRNIGLEVTHYLEDIEDHLERMQDELASFAQELTLLKDEWNSYLDRRMNNVLYVLTLVTTLAVPAQFLTGYFGMNFIDDDGEPGAPLLRKGGVGVILFWVIVLASTGSVFLIMYHYKWFERPKEI